jgi:hypothetical protein
MINPTAINKARRIPATIEITRCRRPVDLPSVDLASVDLAAVLCAAPTPVQNPKFPIGYLAVSFVFLCRQSGHSSAAAQGRPPKRRKTCQDPTALQRTSLKATNCGHAPQQTEAASVCRDGRRLLASCPQLKGYKPRQNRRRIELANDAFYIAKTSRQRVHGNDIAVPGRSQGDKAQIEK